MSDFLSKLKEAVEKGEFNSDAANKINEISGLAEEKMSAFKEGGKDTKEAVNTIREKLNKIVDDTGHRTVSEEEALKLNTEYEKKMAEFKKVDLVLSELNTLIQIEELVLGSIDDMFIHIEDIEDKYLDKYGFEFENDESFKDLVLKIKEIKEKYNSFIN
jgi:hypothetical protein